MQVPACSLSSLTIFVLALSSKAALCRAEAIDVSYGQTYVTRDSGPLKADMYVPHSDGAHPAVLVVHGGAWSMGTRAQLAGVAKTLAEHGYTAAAISYRLAPKFQFPAQIDDCKAAVRWLRSEAEKWKIDPQRIGGFGYSAGAQLVTLLGTTDAGDGLEGVADPKQQPSTRLQCVVGGGTPSDFRTLPPNERMLAFWLGGTPAEKPRQYQLASPRAFVTADDPPMFLFHGGSDELVPILSAEAMERSLKTAGIESELYVAKDLGHMAASMDRESLRRAFAFLDKYLKPTVATDASAAKEAAEQIEGAFQESTGSIP